MNKVLSGLLVVALGMVGFLTYRQKQLENLLIAQQHDTAAQVASYGQQLELVKAQRFEHQTDVLAAGSINVGSEQPIRIIVDTDKMRHVNVSGRFTAPGGSGNNIEVLLVDEDNYTNWKGRHEFKALYKSGRTTVANVEVPISDSGVYYLVFNDNISLISSKTVNADLKLDYEKRVN